MRCLPYVVKIFKSYFCQIAFLLFLVGSYFLIPKNVFYGWYNVLAGLFMVAFALTLTCLARNIKEKVILAKTYKSSILGIIATALGLSVLQVCGVGAPVCGASIGAGVVSLFFPSFALNFFEKYSLYIIIGLITIQIIALYYMKCFVKICGPQKTQRSGKVK